MFSPANFYLIPQLIVSVIVLSHAIWLYRKLMWEKKFDKKSRQARSLINELEQYRYLLAYNESSEIKGSYHSFLAEKRKHILTLLSGFKKMKKQTGKNCRNRVKVGHLITELREVYTENLREEILLEERKAEQSLSA